MSQPLATTPRGLNDQLTALQDRVRQIDDELASAREISEVMGREDLVSTLRSRVGEAALASLTTRAAEVAQANHLRTELASTVTETETRLTKTLELERAKAAQIAAEAARRPDPYAPPDAASRASARREYARDLKSHLVNLLLSDKRVDPTLVSLRVSTMTPQSLTGITRSDYRLVIETNSISLPRDVTALLRNSDLNGSLYRLGFKEVSFQDSVDVQRGTVLCQVVLSENGALPKFCVQMGLVSDGTRHVLDWAPYHRWPEGYAVP